MFFWCFSSIKFLSSFFRLILNFLDLFLLELIIFTFTFFCFFEQKFPFCRKKPFSNDPFLHACVTSLCDPFVHPFVHLLSLFFLLVFSFLPHVFYFSFFCFLCLWLLLKTSIWNFCIVCIFTLLFGTCTALFVFACLSFLSVLFFFKKKFPFLFYSCVFLNILLFLLSFFNFCFSFVYFFCPYWMHVFFDDSLWLGFPFSFFLLLHTLFSFSLFPKGENFLSVFSFFLFFSSSEEGFSLWSFVLTHLEASFFYLFIFFKKSFLECLLYLFISSFLHLLSTCSICCLSVFSRFSHLFPPFKIFLVLWFSLCFLYLLLSLHFSNPCKLLQNFLFLFFPFEKLVFVCFFLLLDAFLHLFFHVLFFLCLEEWFLVFFFWLSFLVLFFILLFKKILFLMFWFFQQNGEGDIFVFFFFVPFFTFFFCSLVF